MCIRKLSYIFLASVLLYNFTLTRAIAKDNETKVRSSQSSGLTVTISRVMVSQKKINLQFIASNNTKVRIYLKDAMYEQSQKAFLGSGSDLNDPRITGLESCHSDVISCSNDTARINNLDEYSYI